jgi:Rrf2 family protein
MLAQSAEYALRAAAHLAAAPGLRTTAEIAAATGVPEGYLTDVLRRLVRAGLVASRRGSRGGVCLARPPGEVTARAVVNAVAPLRRTDAGLPPPGPAGLRRLHEYMDRAWELAEDALAATTLADLLDDGPAGNVPDAGLTEVVAAGLA